jgi:hypothetical protein
VGLLQKQPEYGKSKYNSPHGAFVKWGLGIKLPENQTETE